MRQIKFRAWHVNEDMCYFDLDGETLREGINDSSFHDVLMHEEEYDLMEWTGYTDVNSKRIYEGDIVKFAPTLNEWVEEPSSIHEIKWSTRHGGWNISSITAPTCKVLGNKYENVSLLEKIKYE